MTSSGPALPDLAPAVVLRFAAGGDLCARLIEWFGGNLGFRLGWSHVDAVLPADDPQAGWLLGARHDRVGGQRPGVQVRPPGYLDYPRTMLVRIPASPAEIRAFYAELRGQVGKPYSSETIAGLALGLNLHERAGWICDALIAWCLIRAGLLPRQLFAYVRRLTPNALYLICLTATNLRRVR